MGLELLAEAARHASKQEYRKAAKAYRVYTSVAKEDAETDDYLLDHSIVLYFVGPSGEFLDFFTQSTPPSTIAEKILKRHQERVA